MKHLCAVLVFPLFAAVQLVLAAVMVGLCVIVVGLFILSDEPQIFRMMTVGVLELWVDKVWGDA